MKRLLFLGVIALCQQLHGQVSVYECTPENSTITQQELNANVPELTKTCVWFDSPTPYHFTGNQQKTIHATNEIHIKTNFHANPSNNGGLHLQAGNKGDFDVVCMNYTDIHSVLKLKKLELGITLPLDIQQRVDNFINEDLNSPRINPYLDWEIRVSFDFTHPQIPYSINVDGFYNKEYDSWMVADIPDEVPAGQHVDNLPVNNYQGVYNSLGGYTEVPTTYPFLARFSPPRTGKWKCTVHIYVNNNTEMYHSDEFTFDVINSNDPGYVKGGNESRYFRLGNHSFYPIGANILWPITEPAKNLPGYNDPELQNILKFDYVDPEDQQTKTIVLSEEFRELKPIPRVFDNYRNLIKNIADNGGNFVRLIMNPVSLDIEYEKIGNYTDRLYIAQELDEVLEYCESRNVYIDWNMLIHYVLMPDNESGFTKAWNKKNEWQQYDYCYKHLPGVNNPRDFFTNEAAKAYYKQRIRYILSRWGYSTKIAMWELLSEINTNEIWTNDKDVPLSAADFEIIEAWQAEMTEYIWARANGITHMIAPSYAGLKEKNDDTFKNLHVAVMTTNVYPGLKCYAQNWIKQIQGEYLDESDPNDPKAYTSGYDSEGHFLVRKPFFMSEFNPTLETCDELQIEVRRAMWQAPFTGAAGALSWYGYHNGIAFTDYQKLRNFTSQFDLDQGGWHPGAIEVNNFGEWIYRPDWAADMDYYDNGYDNHSNNPFNNDDSFKADLMYLRSGDKKQAIGVMTNKTFNIGTASTCLTNFWAERSALPYDDVDHVNPPMPIQQANVNKAISNANLKLNGMKNGRFKIRYYRPDRLWQWEDETFSNGPRLALEYRIPANIDEYVVLFHAVYTPLFGIAPEEDSITEISYEEVATIEDLMKDRKSEADTLVAADPAELKIDVYPVPTSNLLEIRKNIPDEFIKVELLSPEGKMIKTFDFSEEVVHLSMTGLEHGIYILKFYLPENEILLKKVIKI